MLCSAVLLVLWALVAYIAPLGSCQRVVVVNTTTASAVFNLNGISGWIRFYENDNHTSILVNLVGLNQLVTEWSIRELSADNTLQPSERCSVSYLGGVYNASMVMGSAVGDLSGRFGPINNNGEAWFNDTLRAVTLQGPGSIVGRSLLLQVGTKHVCATIRSKLENNPDDAVTMHATFISPVGGVVYFRQTGSEPTVVHGKLYFVNEMTATSVEWAIYDDLLTEMYRAGMCGNPSRQFDNLTARHGMLNVSSAPQPYSENAFLFTDNMLMLSGLGTIEGRTLILLQGGTIIGCAPIIASESLEAFQYPNFDFQIIQTSPHENSTLMMSGQVTRSSSYAILNSAWMTNGLCPVSDAEIYNPLDTSPPGNDVINRTPDLFPKGDISGKFGSLVAPAQQLNLPELPMYGQFSMLGLTMREVGTNQARPYRSCSALLPLMDELDNALLAKATFTEGIISGAIYFIQSQSPQNSGHPGMTNIIVDLYYNNPTMSETTAHKWHVHVDLPQPGVECAIAVGWHFNPFNVDLGRSTYGAECGIDAPLRCESGDLSGKHGKLTFSPLGPNRQTMAFVDPNLQLDGEFKIVGRSIGLHRSALLDPDAILFSCAEIKLVELNDASFDIVVAFPDTPNFERVAFTKQLIEMTSLDGRVDPSDLLILHEEVGTVQSANPARVCATTVMKITASNVQEANTYASILQNSACVKFVENGCMAQLPDYSRLCAGASGAQAAASLSALVLITGLVMNALF